MIFRDPLGKKDVQTNRELINKLIHSSCEEGLRMNKIGKHYKVCILNLPHDPILNLSFLPLGRYSLLIDFLSTWGQAIIYPVLPTKILHSSWSSPGFNTLV